MRWVRTTPGPGWRTSRGCTRSCYVTTIGTHGRSITPPTLSTSISVSPSPRSLMWSVQSYYRTTTQYSPVQLASIQEACWLQITITTLCKVWVTWNICTFGTMNHDRLPLYLFIKAVKVVSNSTLIYNTCFVWLISSPIGSEFYLIDREREPE